MCSFIKDLSIPSWVTQSSLSLASECPILKVSVNIVKTGHVQSYSLLFSANKYLFWTPGKQVESLLFSYIAWGVHAQMAGTGQNGWAWQERMVFALNYRYGELERVIGVRQKILYCPPFPCLRDWEAPAWSCFWRRHPEGIQLLDAELVSARCLLCCKSEMRGF